MSSVPAGLSVMGPLFIKSSPSCSPPSIPHQCLRLPLLCAQRGSAGDPPTEGSVCQNPGSLPQAPARLSLSSTSHTAVQPQGSYLISTVGSPWVLTFKPHQRSSISQLLDALGATQEPGRYLTDKAQFLRWMLNPLQSDPGLFSPYPQVPTLSTSEPYSSNYTEQFHTPWVLVILLLPHQECLSSCLHIKMLLTSQEPAQRPFFPWSCPKSSDQGTPPSQA